MKTFKTILVSLILSVLLFSWVSAGFFDAFIGDGAPDIRICNDGECGLQEGVDIVKDGINGIETDRSFSQYIQDIAIYIISFISIVAVIYIIYAGFQILIWNGDEEKMKKSKQTILYVIIGIIVIWMAWPITRFIIGIINN